MKQTHRIRVCLIIFFLIHYFDTINLLKPDKIITFCFDNESHSL